MPAKLSARPKPTRKTPSEPGQVAGPAPANGFGVEVDGNTVRAVEVRKGRVCAFQEQSAETPLEALGALGKPPRGMRSVISWSSGMQVARTEISNVPLGLRSLAIADAAEAMFPADSGGLVTAGYAGLSEPDPDLSEIEATVVAIRRETIAAVSRQAAKWRATMVPAPLTLTSDGLYLALGHATASVTLVERGVATANRELVAGAPSWGSPGLSERDVAGYFDLLFPELAATLATWGSRGRRMPVTCFAVGPGARATGLAARLGSIGLASDAPPSPRGVEQYDLPASEITEAYLAICAVAAPDDPSLRLVDPVVLAEVEAARRRHRKRVLRSASAAAAIAVVAAGVVPLVAASDTLHAAQRLEAADQAKAESVARWTAIAARVDAVAGEERSVAAQDLHYSKRLAVLFDTAPSGTTYSSVSTQAASKALAVNVTATIPGSGFAPIAAWVTRLEAAGATSVDAQNFAASTSGGGSTLTLSAELPSPSTSHSSTGRSASTNNSTTAPSTSKHSSTTTTTTGGKP